MEDDEKHGSGIDLKKMQESLDITLANETPETFEAWQKSRGLENEPPLTNQEFVDEYGGIFPDLTLENLEDFFRRKK